jgi:DNA-binding CsgD family transcriptional regulator
MTIGHERRDEPTPAIQLFHLLELVSDLAVQEAAHDVNAGLERLTTWMDWQHEKEQTSAHGEARPQPSEPTLGDAVRSYEHPVAGRSQPADRMLPIGTPTAKIDGELPGTPLRGRHREWAQMLAALHAAQFQSTVLVLTGPPGVGKTRLLHELTTAALRRGCPVFEHRGSIATDAIPQRMAGHDQPEGRMTALSTVSRPLVVVWDDAQWQHGALLPHPTMTSVSSPVLWALATSGHGISAPGNPSNAVHIEIAPLDPAAVEQVVSDLLGAGPAPDLLALARMATGNPARLVDLAVSLRDEHAIDVRDGVAHLAATALPNRVRLRLLDHLTQTSSETRRLILVASALGTSFGMADLAELMRQSVVGLLPALEEAHALGLLVSDGDRLGFPHELVRSAVADSLPGPVRRALRYEADRRPAGPPRRQLATPDRTTDRRSGWDGLTHREQIIARFASQGMTNRQIASALYLSPHTVNFHLRQIFRKLDIHRRAELTSPIDTQGSQHSEGKTSPA